MCPVPVKKDGGACQSIEDACIYLRARFVCGLPSRWEGCDGEAVRVFSVSDLGLLHQVVQLFLGHVLHLLPVGCRLEEGGRVKQNDEDEVLSDMTEEVRVTLDSSCLVGVIAHLSHEM